MTGNEVPFCRVQEVIWVPPEKMDLLERTGHLESLEKQGFLEDLVGSPIFYSAFHLPNLRCGAAYMLNDVVTQVLEVRRVHRACTDLQGLKVSCELTLSLVIHMSILMSY